VKVEEDDSLLFHINILQSEENNIAKNYLESKQGKEKEEKK